MTYVSTIDPAERDRREQERRIRNQNEAFAVMQAATSLNAALERSGGLYSTAAMHRLLDLCNAVIGMVDDGDCLAQRDTLMWELSCDEHGNPVDEDGNPPASFDQSLVHPDNPSQLGGWL